MKKSFFAIILIMVFAITFNVEALAKDNEGYSYDYYNQIVAAPNAYFVDEVITPQKLGLSANTEFKDIQFNKNNFYLLTKIDFYIFDYDYNLLFQLDLFDSSDRDNDYLRDARGLAVQDNYIYISEYDTREVYEGNEVVYHMSRLLIFSTNDVDGNPLDNEIRFEKLIRLRMDQNIPGVTEVGFHPQRIDVDSSGRIYLTAESVYQGIMEIDYAGNFKKFVGTNEVKISALEAFWKTISPNVAGRKLYLPISFSSLAVDPAGFVYATTSTTEVKPVQKFNFRGDNVLIENGNTKVVGDVYNGEGISEFVDIDINDYGVYLGLNVSKERTDIGVGARNRIFAYNDNGELLYIIGNYQANDTDYLERPSVVRWNDNDIVVVDNASLGNRILVYKETDYGKNINLATKHYYNGQFEDARPYWDLVMSANTNNDLAYIGIGKIYYQEGRYDEALEYFKLGNSRIYYSKAYNKTRNQALRVAIPYIIIGALIIYVGAKGYSIWKKRQQD